MIAATIESSIDKLAAPKNTLLELYSKMLTVCYVEERLKAFAKQGKCSFVASVRGHEMTQIAMTLLLKPGHDWFFTTTAPRRPPLELEFALKDVFLGMLGREGDPNSGGRNMPEHFSSRELNYVSQTACTGSQYLPAVGMAKAVKLDGSDRIVYVESGEAIHPQGNCEPNRLIVSGSARRPSRTTRERSPLRENPRLQYRSESLRSARIPATPRIKRDDDNPHNSSLLG